MMEIPQDKARGAASSTPFDFCQHLQAAGVLDAERAAKVRAQSAATRLPLGRVLIEARFMDVKQVMDVLYRQAEQPGVRIGEMAIALGYLTRPQLERALQYQTDQMRHPFELLMQDWHYTLEELWPHLLRHVKRLEGMTPPPAPPKSEKGELRL